MNIALEQTKEYVNNTLHRTYGDAFIRGNNGEHGKTPIVRTNMLTVVVMYISAD